MERIRKSPVCWYTLVISVLGRKRQVNVCGSPVSQPSLVSSRTMNCPPKKDEAMEQYLGLSYEYTCTHIHTKTWEILGTRVSGLDEMMRSLGVSTI